MASDKSDVFLIYVLFFFVVLAFGAGAVVGATAAGHEWKKVITEVCDK